MTTYHTPVLLNESVDALDINPNGTYVDLTFGGGGHSREILKRLSKKGTLIAFDQDSDAINNIPQDDRIIFIHNNFKYMRGSIRACSIDSVDGILADLGVSSHHFDDSARGFSFRFDSQLDMRMNTQSNFSALELIATYDHKQMLSIFREYGELSSPHKIASAIENARSLSPITTTFELIEAVKRVTPKWEESKFLAKLFQAIRIEVNGEMEALKMMLEQSLRILKVEGRLSVITYHSLEDRLVKNFIKSCNFEGKVEKDIYGNCSSPLNSLSKVIVPSESEIENNSRARSAKLRIAQKTAQWQ